MRYHKVTPISSPEAFGILHSAWVSLNPHPVMNLFDEWYDIRRMSVSEVNGFTDDWMRNMAAELKAGRVTPH